MLVDMNAGAEMTTTDTSGPEKTHIVDLDDGVVGGSLTAGSISPDSSEA